MPPPPTTPASLASLLSSLRAPIFHTSHNPTPSARTALKYLKRRLRGPSMVRYYPQSFAPSLKSLNYHTEINQFAGWRGDDPSLHAARKVNGEIVGSQLQANTGGRQLMGNDVVEPGWSEVDRKWHIRTSRFPSDEIVDGKRQGPDKSPPVDRMVEAGWLEDAKERDRSATVALKKALGKGPPKKGHGRRSQMKKR